MIHTNMAEFKARMSHYLRLVKSGERVVLCDRNIPIAELTLIKSAKPTKRVLGQYAGLIHASDDAFAPLADEELKDWYGGDS